ncbi:hypothetical protein FIU87_19730 [Bacillus sp. THAF10]|nr:hypothetical protein [Bacillus sp. THAF10]QFT90881.1 hypothetical protein FIU87_19730 [Bacillus sp. THAF10]
MISYLKKEWHKFWYINYNHLLASEENTHQQSRYLSKSKYHSEKLMQLL